MKFFTVTLLAFATSVLAAPSGNSNELFIRQEFVVDTDAPAMTDKQGNVVPFDSTQVNQPNTDAGL